jgi:hypothetical protein
MFPFGIAAEKEFQGRRIPWKPKQPGACQLWHTRRQLSLRQGVDAGGSGRLAVMDAGRLSEGN